jgi:predicted RNA-binding protein YlxR (DUF448 family)
MRRILADRQMDQAPELTYETRDQPEGPLRRCLITRASMPKECMLRFVVGPDDDLIFDVASTLPGRGLWLSTGRDVVEMALKRGVFAKAAKQRVLVPGKLADHVIASLERRVAELLGLTRRSGTSLAGFEKVREMMAAGRCMVLVEACDGSLAERARLLNGRDIPVLTPLNAARLGTVFGRDAVMHVGLAAGKLAAMIKVEASRLAGMDSGIQAVNAFATSDKSGQREAKACFP